MDLCSQLNYVRSLSTGKAYFYYLSKDDEMRPIGVDRTRLRAPKGGYAEAYKGNNFSPKNVAPQDLAYANPQYIEECYVTPGVDDVYCAFPLRIRANSLSPDVCNDDSVRDALLTLAATYKDLNGYQELAHRYAKNILLGTWLWRNKECRSLSIEVVTSDKEKIVLENSTNLSWYGRWDEKATESLELLTAYLTRALTDRSEYFYMDIRAKLSVGWGDEIYPSQEYLDSREDGVPTKQLATVELKNGKETAAFHGQKIGAALQSIDDWWHEDADKPLRVNEYGADREYVIARRHVALKNDFYHLLKNTESWTKQMKKTNVIPNEVHFIMSVLAKGGLFNGSSGKAKRGRV
ncbi:type I-F CRISPR-associated protein Csy3 [Vibrionales bacterium C3R12]|uniref:type I-F CRISPR-associated protein Csy3 n=1 Tax=Vibrio sp. 03-59-1 TaxID=2607607 RepID=UPI000DEAC413|nr:type I-F CRISPR-associated protein Csy3 [Vibrio sp. 03-59-1]NOH84236.1 type I-F CRISPR-associated protein Csy3 [Vibrio sp. 03-59-1]RBW65540.1 type I-F CRISPR-associated protein Csy3 [Vibrionales bacterium C3R12]